MNPIAPWKGKERESGLPLEINMSICLPYFRQMSIEGIPPSSSSPFSKSIVFPSFVPSQLRISMLLYESNRHEGLGRGWMQESSFPSPSSCLPPKGSCVHDPWPHELPGIQSFTKGRMWLMVVGIESLSRETKAEYQNGKEEDIGFSQYPLPGWHDKTKSHHYPGVSQLPIIGRNPTLRSTEESAFVSWTWCKDRSILDGLHDKASFYPETVEEKDNKRSFTIWLFSSMDLKLRKLK